MQQNSHRKLAVILFMDIVGYTTMVQESESKALNFVRIHKVLVEQLSKKYGGSVINYYGDASMTMFHSAVNAVECAVELQKAFHNGYKLPMRMGLHLGEVVMENDTIYGNGVNIASRLESLGTPGSILISSALNVELSNQEKIETVFLGTFSFKNVEQNIGVYAVKNEELIVPKASELKSEKGKKAYNKWIMLSVVIAILIPLAWIFKQQISEPDEELTVQEEKIAVLPFKNFTGNSEIDFIGEMAAHRITKELFEIEKADVIDFQTKQQIESVKYSSFATSINEYASQSGAINILEGSYNQKGPDSLTFSAIIKRLSDGAYIHTFRDVHFSLDDPIVGVSELTNYVNGYWEVKDKKLLSFPKLDAYKKYIKAQNSWITDFDLAEKNLLEAIEIDSNFHDANTRLLALYYNTSQNNEANALLNSLMPKLENMTKRQQNIIKSYKAYYEGDNVASFHYTKRELDYNPKDLYVNTGFMAISNDYVHNYTATINAFEEIDIKGLDIADCPYCESRLTIGLIAALGLNKKDLADELIKLFPKNPSSTRSFSAQFRYFATYNKISEINAIIAAADQGINIGSPISLRYVAARELFLEGRTDEAKRFSSELLELAKAGSLHHNWALFFLNRLDESENGFKSAIDGYRDIRDYSQLGVISGMVDNREKAMEYVSKIEKLEEENFGDIEYYQARIYQSLGEKEKALTLLQSAIDEGALFLSFNVFENDPGLVSLRDDPEFNKIIFPMKDEGF